MWLTTSGIRDCCLRELSTSWLSILKFLGYGNLYGVVDTLTLEYCGEPNDIVPLDIFNGLLEKIHVSSRTMRFRGATSI